MGETIALAVGCFAAGLFCGIAFLAADKLYDPHPERDETHAATRYALQRRCADCVPGERTCSDCMEDKDD